MALIESITRPLRSQKKSFKWYHGLLFMAGITVVERGLEKLTKKANNQLTSAANDKAYYQSLNLPVFAPPAPAFPIAWALSDLAILWGNLRVLNMPQNTPGRKEYLSLQAASWTIYAFFSAMHFGLRSPINAALLTTAHAGLTTASEVVALTQLKDKKVALSLAPVLSWLVIALPTAATTALWNRDRLYKKGPFIDAPANWMKISLN